MLLNKKGETVTINGVIYAIEQRIVVNENSEYRGLEGIIREIHVNSDEVVLNGDAVEIYCDFFPLEDEEELTKLKRAFNEMYGQPVDVGLDHVVLAPSMFEFEPNISIDKQFSITPEGVGLPESLFTLLRNISTDSEETHLVIGVSASLDKIKRFMYKDIEEVKQRKLPSDYEIVCWETNENYAYYQFYWQTEWSDGHEWIFYVIIETPFLDAFSDQNAIPNYLDDFKKLSAKISDQERTEYDAFLDNLRDSGETNMYGAVPHLMDAFPKLRFDELLARRVLRAWRLSHNKE